MVVIPCRPFATRAKIKLLIFNNPSLLGVIELYNLKNTNVEQIEKGGCKVIIEMCSNKLVTEGKLNDSRYKVFKSFSYKMRIDFAVLPTTEEAADNVL